MVDDAFTPGVTRRRALRAAGVGLVGGAGLAGGTAAAAPVDIAFEDQESDGETVVLARLEAEVEGDLVVLDTAQGENELFGTHHVEADTVATDYEVPLDAPIPSSQAIRILFFHPEHRADDPDVLAQVEAMVAVGDDSLESVGSRFVEPTESDPFDYPYYLFTPADVEEDAPLLVEPNNTGTATDDFAEHREAARRVADSGMSRNLSEDLGVPLLVPVFPRPESDPVNWEHYVHQLDRETLSIEDGPLERVDLQLLAMIDDARDRLDTPVREQVMLNGFSASGNFVDRFTVLHPDRVLSVTAGGLNGMALLPASEFSGRELPFHVGIADIEGLTGSTVDLDALDDVNQFLYMGADDDNDTIPFDDAWTDDDLRETALDVYGEEMITERFPTCQEAYDRAGVDAQFRVYPDAGHTPRPAIEDITEFHRRSMRGEDVSDFGETLGFSVPLTLTPEAPEPNEQVEFDASGAEIGPADLVAITWDFGDGDTAAGEVVTHTYTDAGTYELVLRAVDENGAEHVRAFEVTVGGDDAGIDADAVDPDPTDEDIPGFGVWSALAGVGGAGYLLKRRVGRDGE